MNEGAAISIGRRGEGDKESESKKEREKERFVANEHRLSS